MRWAESADLNGETERLEGWGHTCGTRHAAIHSSAGDMHLLVKQQSQYSFLRVISHTEPIVARSGNARKLQSLPDGER